MNEAEAAYQSAFARVKLAALEAVERLIRTTQDPVELRRLALGIVKTAPPKPAKPARSPRPSDPAPSLADLAALLGGLDEPADPALDEPSPAPQRVAATVTEPAPPLHPAPLTLNTTPIDALRSHAGTAKQLEKPTARPRGAHQSKARDKYPP